LKPNKEDYLLKESDLVQDKKEINLKYSFTEQAKKQEKERLELL
jgi:hypothetical protein